MRKRRNISNQQFIVIVLLALSASALQTLQAAGKKDVANRTKSAVTLDPLGLSQDTVIAVTPHSDAESRLRAEMEGADGILTSQTARLSSQIDSATNQVYRIQLLTVDSYSDARRALAVAEEIFDLPVTLTYDQPYYKLRVGEFATKSDADSYLPKAKAAGYVNGWVLLTTVGVKELRPLYETAAPQQPPDAARNPYDPRD